MLFLKVLSVDTIILNTLKRHFDTYFVRKFEKQKINHPVLINRQVFQPKLFNFLK